MSLGHITEADKDISIAEPKYLKKLDVSHVTGKKDSFVKIEDYVYSSINDYPWNLEDESCFEIHCVDNISRVKDIKEFMEECWRVLVPRGLFVIEGPYANSLDAMANPEYVRLVSEKTFLYFNHDWLKNTKSTFSTKANFKIETVKYHFDNEFATRSEDAKNWAREHYVNVVKNFEITLRKIK